MIIYLKYYQQEILLLERFFCKGNYLKQSSLLVRLSDNIFSDQFLPTIGVDFKILTFDLEGKSVRMQIWDTAGQERFKTITSQYPYYKGAHGIILIYDITDKQSFQDIENWLADIQKHTNENIVKLLVGNKCDLESKRKVTLKEAQKFADNFNIKFIESSAKANKNTQQPFMTLARDIKGNLEKGDDTTKGKANYGNQNQIQLNAPHSSEKNDGGCC